MTPEQQKALAIARARRRRAEAASAATPTGAADLAPTAEDAAQPAGRDPLGWMKRTRAFNPDMSAEAQEAEKASAREGGRALLRTVDAAMRGAADTATFGLADELAAGAGAATGVGGEFGEYSANLEGQRARDRSDAENFPAARFPGQVAGGLMLASRLPSVLANASSLGGRVLGGAATGLGYGGAHGFGSGEEGVGNRLVRALLEGGTGLTIGAALPMVGSAATSGVRRVADALFSRGAAKEVGTSPDVLRAIGRVMEADGTLGPTGQQNMAAAGPAAMLADAGPNARAVLDTAIQRGGPGATMARDRIGERVAAGAEDLVSTLDNTLGVPQGVTATRTAIRTGSAAARGSAYDDAYTAPIDYSKPAAMEIEDIVKNRVPESAIKAANALMRAEGNQSAQILAKIGDDGSVVLERLPDVRQLDYLTRGLNEVAEQANASGKLGGTTATGRAYGNLATEIRDRLKSLVPEYETALATAADPIRRSQAVELGSKLLSPAMRRDQVAEAVAGMTGAERDALAQGVRSQIDDLMANVTRTVQDGDVPAREAVKALKDLSSRASREKLELVLGERAGPLFDELDRIGRSFDLKAAVADNSKTYARLATERAVGDMTNPGVLGKLAEGKPLEASKRVAQAITGTRPQDRLVQQDAIYSELADLLTRPGGRVYDAVSRVGKTDESTRLIADRLARVLSGRNAYPLAVQAESYIPLGPRR